MSYSTKPPRPYLDGPQGPVDRLGFGGYLPEEYELSSDDDEFGLEDEEYGRRQRFFDWGHQFLTRAAWVGLAALLALGSAGIVAATGSPPMGSSRPELTYGADGILSARFDAATRDLARLNDDVTYLGDMARGVLSDLTQVNQVRLDADHKDGDRSIAAIAAGKAKLTAQLDCRPWTADFEASLARTYSQPLIDRYQELCLAIDTVDPLAADWNALVAGSAVTMQVVDDINGHDNSATEALQFATQGRYPDALGKLADASKSLAAAQSIATNLAKVGDVSTLNEWLGRIKDMDDSLRLLWQTMVDSKGRVTAQVTAALKSVSDAKALLPENNAVLSVVVNEVSAGLPAHGISIEASKGALQAALSDLTGAQTAGP
jgi:hypothetical protein